jgi:hypothetical protein
MKLLAASVAVAALLTTGHATAQEAASDPLRAIYRITGVLDSGDASGVGNATTFICTNFSNVEERIRYSLREESSGGTVTKTATLASQETYTVSTHSTDVYSEDDTLDPGVSYRQGSMVISATTTNIHCTAMQVDASTSYPQGIALHMVRIRPANNSQE